jgi:hypothetical protein
VTGTPYFWRGGYWRGCDPRRSTDKETIQALARHAIPSHEIAERRDAALKRTRDAVHSSRFRVLTLDVAAWLEVGQWTNPQDDLVRDQGHLPISDFATEQLAGRLRKIRKKGKALDRLDAFAAGLLTGREDARIEAAMTVATDAYEDLRGSSPFGDDPDGR